MISSRHNNTDVLSGDDFLSFRGCFLKPADGNAGLMHMQHFTDICWSDVILTNSTNHVCFRIITSAERGQKLCTYGMMYNHPIICIIINVKSDSRAHY